MGGNILKTQFYKEKGYEFNIKRQCKSLSISCNKFIESINNNDLNLAKVSFNLIIDGCKNIRTTIPPVKYKEIHKQIRKVCSILMKLYRNMFCRFIDEIWTEEYKDRLYQASELLKVPLNEIESMII